MSEIKTDDVKVMDRE